MKIAKLLELHNQHTNKESLAANFGDGYLLKNNRIYRNIRFAVLERGYKFSNEFNPDYLALPFGQLESILRNRLIPFADNVGVLEKLVLQMKDSVEWNDIADGIKRNYVFHEACHGVARAEFEVCMANSADCSHLEKQQQKVLQILLEESFANTCELLAIMDANDSAHRIFYETNSYTYLFENRTQLKTAVDEIGESVVFKLLMIAYLHSNFLKNSLDEKSFDRALHLASLGSKLELDSKYKKSLKALSKIAFTLDLRFRAVTTGFHLRLSGLDKTIDQISEFDLMGFMEKNPNYLKLLNLLTRVVQNTDNYNAAAKPK